MDWVLTDIDYVIQSLTTAYLIIEAGRLVPKKRPHECCRLRR